VIEGLFEEMTPEQREQLTKQAEAVIAAVDQERDAVARSRAEKAKLRDLMDSFTVTSVEALGRTIEFKTENKRQLTLTALKEVMGAKLAEKVWKNLPTKPGRHLEIPGYADHDPE